MFIFLMKTGVKIFLWVILIVCLGLFGGLVGALVTPNSNAGTNAGALLGSVLGGVVAGQIMWWVLKRDLSFSIGRLRVITGSVLGALGASSGIFFLFGGAMVGDGKIMLTALLGGLLSMLIGAGLVFMPLQGSQFPNREETKNSESPAIQKIRVVYPEFQVDSISPPWLVDDESSDFEVIGEVVASTVPGKPIEIELFFGQYRGYGTLLFSPDGVHVHARPFTHSGGSTPMHPKTPLLFLLIDFLRWKRSISVHVDKNQLTLVSLKGRTLEISFPGSGNQNYVLVVSKADGERMYRELFLHFPADFSKWAGKTQLK